MRQLKIGTQITNRDTQAVEKYLQEISKIPMISPDEETVLAKQIKLLEHCKLEKSSKEYKTIERKSKQALDKLVEANLRFVVSVAKQYQHQGMSLSDLINEGNLGLIKAASRFDETKGFKFISYAVWWIRQSILQALAEQGRLVRLPQNKIGTYNKVNKAALSFEQEHERGPSQEELAAIVQMNIEDVNNILQTNSRHTSLDAPVHEAEDVTHSDLQASTEFSDQNAMAESIKLEIKRVLDILTKREKDILIASYNLEGDKVTIEAVMKEYDLTRERIRQIKEKAIKRLQKNKVSEILKPYL